MAPRGRKASSTRKIKPQTSNLFLSVHFVSLEPQIFFDGSTSIPGYSVIEENPGLFKFWGNFRGLLNIISPTSSHRHFRGQLFVVYVVYIGVSIPHRLFHSSTLWTTSANYSTCRSLVLDPKPKLRVSHRRLPLQSQRELLMVPLNSRLHPKPRGKMITLNLELTRAIPACLIPNFL